MSNDIMQYNFFKKICALSFVEKVFLFGSRARNDNAKRSDIDLAVDCPQATLQQWQQIIAIIEDADTLLHIDCVRYDFLKDSNLLKQLIDTDAILLYRKKNDTKTDYISI
jgi:predicted nucleotidyltransferase